MYNYIAIEGNIGAGKTFLAKKLANDLNAELILERFNENPFLAKFYKEPQKHAFSLEVSFLLDRFKQLQSRSDTDSKLLVIADYFFDKSLIFARNNLSEHQLKLFEELFHIFSFQLKRPQLVVYLHAELPRLKQNIISRGREYELSISAEYLEGIERGYYEYLKEIKDVPVLYFRLESNNLTQDRNSFHRLKGLISRYWENGFREVAL